MKKIFYLIAMCFLCAILLFAYKMGKTEKITEAKISETDKIDVGKLEFNAGQASFYENEVYFEIEAKNVDPMKVKEGYIIPEVLINGEMKLNVKGMQMEIRENKIIFPFVVILNHEETEENISVDVDIKKVCLNDVINGSWELNFQAVKDKDVNIYPVSKSVICEDGTEIILNSFVENAAGLALKCKVNLGKNVGSAAYYCFQCKDQDGNKYSFYYNFEDADTVTLGCFETEGNVNKRIMNFKQQIKSMTVVCYRIDEKESGEMKAIAEEFELHF